MSTLVSRTAATEAAGASSSAPSTSAYATNESRPASARAAAARPLACALRRPGDDEDADVPDRRRDHLELEVDDRVGVLDAVGVDERVRRDAGRDGDPVGRPRAAGRRAAEAADEQDPEPTRQTPTACAAAAPVPSTVTPTTRTMTGASPRAIGYTTDTSACRYAVARRPKYRSWSIDVTAT